MKAATFSGIRQVTVVDKPEPRLLEPTDVLVEIELAGLCGSDLHPYRGNETGIDVGTTLGHEFTGRVVAVGAAVEQLRAGDPVMSPFSTSCGACAPCLRGLSARCERGQLFGWVEGGRGLEGAQAGLIRVPLADATLVLRPPGLSPIEALLLGDVFATGSFIAARAAVGAATPVAVVGLGAVGLCALLASCQLGAPFVAAIDAVPERLALAASFGATPVSLVDGRGQARPLADVAAEVRRAAGGEGVAAVLEAVGSVDATRLAIAVLRPGGVLSIAGVHTESSFAVSPIEAYAKNLTLAIGRCPARSNLDALCALQLRERLPLERLVTHRLPLDAAADAYRMFDEHREGCIKAVFEP
jgi:threonine dehydrogenase-like Zn-dependent dehydrogenase